MAWRDLASNECPTKVDVEQILSDTLYSVLPRGTIVAFHGNSIPSGWVLCDGLNGTPNLIDRFIMGANHITNGRTGGSDTVTLAEINMPIHDHPAGSLYTNSAGSHSHYCYQPRAGKSDNTNDRDVMQYSDYKATSSSGSHSHSIYGNTGLAGASEPFSILPPYTVLFYIMKL